MLRKEFIRLNVNDNYLSLGNLFRIIKEESDSSNTFMQSDLFCIIFDTDNIADSTVNNYCTGLRNINPKYKNYLKTLKSNYEINKNTFVLTIGKILELIDPQNIIIDNINIKLINNNIKLKHICNKLYSISKNDSDVSINLSNKLYKLLKENNFYEFFVQVLFYVVLDKKQPIYAYENLNEIIEKNIYDTNISIKDIQEFTNLQLNSGIWSIRGIKQLAKKDNPFACFELASMEFYGIITGEPRYEKAYEYYKTAANNNHPVANWAIGYLYYEGYIGNKSKHDLYLALKYFNKARKLKCSNAFNSIGLILLSDNFPHLRKNKQYAINMFEQAISMGNIYAYNNLGRIYEDEKKYKEAFDLYLISADLGESWAANKIGEFYRTGTLGHKDLKKAFYYYNISSESPQYTLCPWSKYNLAKYYYINGNIEIGIKKDLNKSIELLENVSDQLLEASEELIYIYYDLYLNSDRKENYYLDRLMFFKEKCENNVNYNKKVKNNIETILTKINKKYTNINIP